MGALHGVAALQASVTGTMEERGVLLPRCRICGKPHVGRCPEWVDRLAEFRAGSLTDEQKVARKREATAERVRKLRERRKGERVDE